MTNELTFTEEELSSLDAIAGRYAGQPGGTIAVLQDVQDAFGYIPEAAVRWLAGELGIPESRFFGVATFYAQFYLEPRGKNIITACCGTACHVKGSERIINSLRRELSLGDDEETTEDKLFTVEKVNCVGACSIAPVIIINKKVYGKATSSRMTREVKKLKEAGAAPENGGNGSGT